MAGPDDTGRVLLDPNELSEDGTVSLSDFDVTDDGSLLAYGTNRAGSDWTTWQVRETATAVDRDDVVEWSKYSGVSWLKDGSGFIYGTVDRPAEGAEYLEAATPHRSKAIAQATDRLAFLDATVGNALAPVA